MIKIVVDNRQHILGLSKEQRKKLEQYLTVPNPKYEAAKKFSKWGAPKRIPKSLIYFDREKDGVLLVPRGVDVCKVLGVTKRAERYEMGIVPVKKPYPEFLYSLRDEQAEAEEAYMDSYKSRSMKSVIHLPTGKGKTILALHIAQKLSMKTLVLVHRTNLLEGWKKDIEDVFGGKLEVGIIQGKKRRIGEQITIAMVQTLNNFKDKELEELSTQFGLVVQDEVHHTGAETFNIVDLFKAHYRLGLSATPHRKDGLDCCLEFFYGGLCYKYVYKEKDEDICSVSIKVKSSKLQFVPVAKYEKKSGRLKGVVNACDVDTKDSEFSFYRLDQMSYRDRPKVVTTEMDAMMMNNLPYRRQVLNDIFKERRLGHKVVALFKQKEYLDLFYNSLVQYVPESEVLKFYGDSELSDRELLEKADSEEITITLATFQKVAEGTNVKSWEILFLVSSVADPNTVEQAIGRVRRRKEGKIDPVRVYDYKTECYSFNRHFPERYEVYRKLKCGIYGLENCNANPFSRGRN